MEPGNEARGYILRGKLSLREHVESKSFEEGSNCEL